MTDRAGRSRTGWADRFAERLDLTRRATGEAGLLYANLAVRGKLLAQIDEDQIEPALAMEPDLVSLIGGLNDVIRPVATSTSSSPGWTRWGRLAASGATVLTITYRTRPR